MVPIYKIILILPIIRYSFIDLNKIVKILVKMFKVFKQVNQKINIIFDDINPIFDNLIFDRIGHVSDNLFDNINPIFDDINKILTAMRYKNLGCSILFFVYKFLKCPQEQWMWIKCNRPPHY